MVAAKTLKKEFPSVLDSAYEQYKRDLKRYKLVKEIMSKNVVTTTPEATMYEAARIMGEKHIGSLIVKKYDTAVGIVTERDLLSEVLAREKDMQEEKVEKIMSYPLVTICSTAKIKEAAQTMVNEKGRLAVFECGKLLGIITSSDLIRGLPEVNETKVKVDDFMTKRVITADETTPVKAVAKTMGEQRIGSVIITRRGIATGIFTERDLLTTLLAKAEPLETNVGAQASSPLVTAPAGTSVHKAAATMAVKHIRRLPISEKGKLVGIVTARDLVEAYAK
ncbi:MAG: CBS domain-containing protein [Thaumarchaeota archaeon]|nr:CBS domain-containing protein [Nitrososphaerota archaeon]MCL5318109.1 CBS domain-containing protein [Nitrososphaerota archaeon]